MTDSGGRAGGLILFWVSGGRLEIQSYSNSHIDAHLVDDTTGLPCRFVGFYGNPATAQRVQSWNLMHSLITHFSFSWLVAKDYNELLKAKDKLDGVERPFLQIERFYEVIANCDLLAIPITDSIYTWSKHWDNGSVFQCLDRGLMSASWGEMFADVKKITF